jgi:prolipoprotein diacylglyceryltransferase
VAPAVITFQFDPLAHLGDWTVRWETLAIGVAILVALVVAGFLAGRVRMPVSEDDPPGAVDRLRRDDILFIALGVAPGAVVGGRIAYVALHLDYYSSNVAAIVDPMSGALSLSGAVLLGALTGGLVARLFDAPLGRWYALAVVPMLVVLGLGKAANILGGTGQGVPSTLDWATRYLGPGPWGSLGPDIPSIPAQAVEAIGVGIVLVVMVAVLRLVRRVGWEDGRGFALALAGWAIVRFIVASSWRDPAVAGPLKAEQLFDLGIVAVAALVLAWLVVRSRRSPQVVAPVGPPPPELSWPDPETRRRF